MGKDKNEKGKNRTNPFNNAIQLCCSCGGCCLVHQQFTIEEDLPASQPGTLTVYEANPYEPACIPGSCGPCAGDSEEVEASIQKASLLTLPFGTVIARNIGNLHLISPWSDKTRKTISSRKLYHREHRSPSRGRSAGSIFNFPATPFTPYLAWTFSSFRQTRFNLFIDRVPSL